MADSSGSTPYASFADVVSRFHAVHAAGPSSASAQLDAPMPYEEVLDEGNGMVEALMGSLEK
jgi:hypothetical protein